MRGGFGRAGRYRHKRSKLIRTGEFSQMRYAEKKGFRSIARNGQSFHERHINLIQLAALVERLEREKKLQMEAGIPVVDLRGLGYTKLLGGGAFSKAIKVKVERCSETALRKLKSVGGDATMNASRET
jgi:ribosomal protein L15